MASLGKKTRGRQKIEMKIIENMDDRIITFSKRRAGIYKKMSEISTLCGVEIGFICFSPAGKLFSYGHPSIEHVANRFLNNNNPISNPNPFIEVGQRERIDQLNQQFNEVLSQLDAEKKRENELAQRTSGATTRGWWNTPIDHHLSLKELEELHARSAEFLNELYMTMNNKTAATSSMLAPPDVPAQFTEFTANANEDVAVPSLPPGFGLGPVPAFPPSFGPDRKQF